MPRSNSWESKLNSVARFANATIAASSSMTGSYRRSSFSGLPAYEPRPQPIGSVCRPITPTASRWSRTSALLAIRRYRDRRYGDHRRMAWSAGTRGYAGRQAARPPCRYHDQDTPSRRRFTATVSLQAFRQSRDHRKASAVIDFGWIRIRDRRAWQLVAVVGERVWMQAMSVLRLARPGGSRANFSGSTGTRLSAVLRRV